MLDVAVDRFSSDWIILLCLIWIALFAYVKITFPRRLQILLSSFFTDQYVNLYGRDERWLLNNFNLPMGILFFTSFAFGVYRLASLRFPEWIEGTYGVEIYMSIVLGVVVFYVSKSLLLIFTSRVLQIEPLVRESLLSRFSRLQFASVVFFAFTFVSFFSAAGGELIFYIGLILFLLSVLISFIRSMSRLRISNGFYLYYIILYICALEIAPLSILLKVVLIS
jgi:hypothetical protein